ncbi:Retrovirus-related Pol polyprotein from transposon TNT 1-94 [Gossypium australe]|uniref:Retrovirus-related Pol polyprotein from transposon TNT 1-94 n=1 Tax=Gossypium australe TaxID=47621 RepID=A0A5B6VBA7_9ROSI|nr:Retrovirus-related Pol polyprotein from transposon TNT 1-94 [Gossypium australe]
MSIARSTMESEFITLDKAGEEVEWLLNLLKDISCWPKPVLALLSRIKFFVLKPLMEGQWFRAERGKKKMVPQMEGTQWWQQCRWRWR